MCEAADCGGVAKVVSCMAVLIETANGLPFLVDDEDASQPRQVSFKDGSSVSVVISSHRWRWVGTGSKRHVATNFCSRLIYVHRAVMQAPPFLQVDHVNRDTSDNRKANLRLATHGQNLANQAKPRKRFAKYRGVRVRETSNGLRFFCTIKKDGKQYWTRLRASEKEAAIDHDEIAKRLYGEFAVLNF